MNRPVLFAVAAVKLATAVALKAADVPDRPILVFLAMGQSNMVGNRPASAEPIDDAHDGRILHRMSSGSRSRTVRGMLADGTPGQVDFVPGVQQGGPDRMFARAIARAGYDVAVVKWARNGSSIEHWVNDAEAAGTYHEEWLRYFIESLEQVRARRRDVRIGGLLWSQGAADSNRGGGAARAPRYEQRLSTLITRFRADVPGAVEAPVVVVRTCGAIDDDRYPFKAEVRSAQQRVADSDPLAVWVDIDDVPLRDVVHHTQAGYQAIGLRAAEAWLKAFADRFPAADISP